ncbi:hypothetical protein [Kitasatospora sp. NPDC088134]|uniref:hypothetical protein n=1 Tax=Kitasatospora sp. NPDC088134 TaxID=3364071 RepID=UPI0037F316F5
MKKKKVRLLLVVALWVVILFGGVTPPTGSLGGFLFGWFGGLVVGTNLTQLLLALLGPLGGLRALSYGVGLGQPLFGLPLGSRRLWVRAVPLPVFHGMYQRARAARGRTWATVTAAYAAPVLLGVALLLAGPDGWWLFGTATAAFPALELLLTARYPGTAGWVVLRLPTAPAEVLVDLFPTPVEADAHLALENGRIADAAALLAGAPAPSGRTGAAIRINVLLAQGRWQEALTAAESLTAGRLHASAWTVSVLRAQVLVCAADAGLLPLPQAVSLLTAELASVGDRPHAAARADRLRLGGDREGALRESARALRASGDSVVTANAFCSRAAALLAAGRSEEAGKALDRARKLLPGLARIALVERRSATVVLEG